MGGSSRHRFWIQSAFDGKIITFPSSGTWLLQEKLAEKEVAVPKWSYEEDEDDYFPSEATAIYICKQTAGQHVGRKAILRIRIQIPDSYPPNPDDREGEKFARTQKYHYGTENEIYYLQKLTKANCPYTPALIDVKRDIQRQPMLGDEQALGVIGGYVVYILMTKVPGKPLGDFFFPGRYSLSEREEIRQQFRKAITFVEQANVLPMDTKPGNVMWDKESRKCFIIDFEDVTNWAEEGYVREWSDRIYGDWGLREPRDRKKA